jgi:hypothetical protein
MPDTVVPLGQPGTQRTPIPMTMVWDDAAEAAAAGVDVAAAAEGRPAVQAVGEKYVIGHVVRCSPCGTTGSPAEPLQVCGRCRAARYCNVACQSGHWKAHKADCARRVADAAAAAAGAPTAAAASAAATGPGAAGWAGRPAGGSGAAASGGGAVATEYSPVD